MGDKTVDPAPAETTIEEELQQWPKSIHTEVAEAEAQGRRQQELVDSKGKRRRTALVALLLLFIVGGLISAWLYLRREQPLAPAQVAKTEPRLDNSKLQDVHTDNKDDFKQTTATVTENGEVLLDVVQYDFYASKFIVNNTDLTNQAEMIKTFRGLRDQLTNGWVVIFTAASVEGHEDHNLRLCSRRLYAVRDMIANEAATTTRGYWGILAGEFKMDLNGVAHQREEEEEEKAAVKFGEKWLSEQRKLIVITIKEKQPIPLQLNAQVPLIVAKHLYDNGVLPKDYDHSDSAPFQLANRKSAQARSKNQLLEQPIVRRRSKDESKGTHREGNPSS